jgi:hypothetical protein
MDAFDEIQARSWANFRRIESLIRLAVWTVSGKDGAARRSEASDVLRAAVVLLHATFEDAIRTLARYRLGRADAAALKIVEDALGARKKPYSFTLTELSNHRDKSVGKFIDDTIEVFLSDRSFGSTNAVSAFLPMIGLNVQDFDDLYPDLSRFMDRRHEIVHTADLAAGGDSEPRPFTHGDAVILELGRSAVAVFVARLLSRLDAPERVNSMRHLAFIQTAERELAQRRKAVGERDASKTAIDLFKDRSAAPPPTDIG